MLLADKFRVTISSRLKKGDGVVAKMRKIKLYNYTDDDVRYCKAGNDAGCWTISARDLGVEVRVEHGKWIWLEQCGENNCFFITLPGVQCYSIFETFRGKMLFHTIDAVGCD